MDFFGTQTPTEEMSSTDDVETIEARTETTKPKTTTPKAGATKPKAGAKTKPTKAAAVAKPTSTKAAAGECGAAMALKAAYAETVKELKANPKAPAKVGTTPDKKTTGASTGGAKAGGAKTGKPPA